MSDPFESLGTPDEQVEPRAAFTRNLRNRLIAAFGPDGPGDSTATAQPDIDAVPLIDVTERTRTMPAATTTVTPYLVVEDGPAALEFYANAFGAVVEEQILTPDGQVGHAGFTIGAARLYLTSEQPDVRGTTPATLGGTSVSLHLEVDDVDAVFARALRAGAGALSRPADYPHGARLANLVDPFGHRWMISHTTEVLDETEFDDRMAAAGYRSERVGPPPASTTTGGGIWAAVNATDAKRMIRFVVDVLGFTEQIVVPGEAPGEVVHSQLAWPEGGIVQVGTAHRAGNEFSERPVGGQSLYVITADPRAVYDRCVVAGVEIIRDMETPEYDPQGSGFAIRDHEGNLWSFGTYGGE